VVQVRKGLRRKTRRKAAALITGARLAGDAAFKSLVNV
jgi:hypothetical protein